MNLKYKFYYCPKWYVDVYSDLHTYDEWIKYYYDRVIKFNKSFNSYEEMIKFVSKDENIEKENLIEQHFSNNPENLACQLGVGIIRKQVPNKHIIFCPIMGFVVFKKVENN